MIRKYYNYYRWRIAKSNEINLALFQRLHPDRRPISIKRVRLADRKYYTRIVSVVIVLVPPPPVEEWDEFIYAWAVETHDSNLGRRNLELHFESSIEKNNDERIIEIGEYIFERLLEEEDLKFLNKMGIEPSELADFINGLRTVRIDKPKEISFKLEVMDQDYSFSRVNQRGIFPMNWWKLTLPEIWNLVSKGLRVVNVRGKKGKLKGGKSGLELLRSKIKGQALLKEFSK